MNQEEVARGGKPKKTRGAVDNEKRLQRFRSAATKKRDTADWSSVSAGILLSVVIEATSAGGAITFGLSRDGGSYMCTLLLEGDRETLWFNGDASMDEELTAIGLMLEDMNNQ